MYPTYLPKLTLTDPTVQSAWAAAVKNLTEINTIPCDFSVYNKTGLLNARVPFMLRAGGSYLGAVLHGVFGILLQEESIALRPSVPACLADSAIEELMIRGKRYALRISGHGSIIISLTANGLPMEKAFLPYSNGTETNEILLTLE